MTAIVAQRFPDRIEIISDGALYDQAGIVRGFECKIERLEGVKGIVTGRGLNAALDVLTERIQIIAGRADSYDHFLVGMQSAMESLREQAAAFPISKMRTIQPFHVIIAGISETTGPILHTFGNTDEGGLAPFELHEMPYGTAYGHSIPAEMHQHILARGGLQSIAVEWFNNIRNDPEGDHASMVVGGHIDFTTVSDEGVVTERIHEWDDQIGRRILPAPTASMSRQQRRALARAHQKNG